jgi:hypothetical protein
MFLRGEKINPYADDRSCARYRARFSAVRGAFLNG